MAHIGAKPLHATRAVPIGRSLRRQSPENGNIQELARRLWTISPLDCMNSEHRDASKMSKNPQLAGIYSTIHDTIRTNVFPIEKDPLKCHENFALFLGIEGWRLLQLQAEYFWIRTSSLRSSVLRLSDVSGGNGCARF